MSRDSAETSEMPLLSSADTLEAVPGYSLIRFLGEGPLARAYECRSDRTGDIVVVKVLTRHTSKDRALVQRVQRDSRLVSGLRSHPHVARVVDVGEAQAGPWVASERLAGRDLRTVLLADGPLPVGDALAAVRDAARALEAAAQVGLMHRNLKPSNLFLLDVGSVKLTDFGFAGPLSRFGGPEGVYGAPAFTAPELLRGAPPDVRTDLYALGAVLFQLITGTPLFEGSPADVLAAHQKKPVPSIATLVPNAGIVVVDLIYRLLQKDPARRPQTAAEAVKLLEEASARNPATRAAKSTSSFSGRSSGKPSFVDPRAPTKIVAPHPFDIPSLPRQETAVMTVETRSPFDPSQDGKAVMPPGDASAAAYAAQPTGVLGTLRQMSVAEILQMLEIGKKSARVEIQLVDGAKGVLHVHDGQIVNCTAGSSAGEPAVVFLCRCKEGYFRIHYEREACERNVTRPTTFVLLEAMRQIDEAGSAPPGEPGAPAASSPALVASSSAPDSADPASASPRARVIPLDPSPPTGAVSARDESSGTARLDDPTLRELAARSGPGGPPAPSSIEGFSPGPPRSAGAAVARAGAKAGAFVDANLPRLEAAARRGRELAAQWLTRADAALEPLRPSLRKVHPGLGEARPVVVVACALGAVLALLFGVASALASSGENAQLDRILAGDADEVIEDLESIPVARRTPAQDLLLGHAYAATLDDERALARYMRAVSSGGADGLALGFLLGRLDASAPDDELDLLVLWPDSAVEAMVTELLSDPRPLVRANAVAVLVERGALGRIDVEQTAILDLQSGGCGMRRGAVGLLRVVGRSPEALAALEGAGDSSSGCLNSNELRAAVEAVTRRR